MNKHKKLRLIPSMLLSFFKAGQTGVFILKHTQQMNRLQYESDNFKLNSPAD